MKTTNVQKAKESVMVSEGYLHIKRLPKNTSREIIDFLNNTDEFGGDWAMGMKFIWDTFKGSLPPKDSQLLSEIELLHQRIDAIEGKLHETKSEPQVKKKRMADGSIKNEEV